MAHVRQKGGFETIHPLGLLLGLTEFLFVSFLLGDVEAKGHDVSDPSPQVRHGSMHTKEVPRALVRLESFLNFNPLPWSARFAELPHLFSDPVACRFLGSDNSLRWFVHRATLEALDHQHSAGSDIRTPPPD